MKIIPIDKIIPILIAKSQNNHESRKKNFFQKSYNSTSRIQLRTERQNEIISPLHDLEKKKKKRERINFPRELKLLHIVTPSGETNESRKNKKEMGKKKKSFEKARV